MAAEIGAEGDESVADARAMDSLGNLESDSGGVDAKILKPF